MLRCKQQTSTGLRTWIMMAITSRVCSGTVLEQPRPRLSSPPAWRVVGMEVGLKNHLKMFGLTGISTAWNILWQQTPFGSWPHPQSTETSRWRHLSTDPNNVGTTGPTIPMVRTTKKIKMTENTQALQRKYTVAMGSPRAKKKELA